MASAIAFSALAAHSSASALFQLYEHVLDILGDRALLSASFAKREIDILSTII